MWRALYIVYWNSYAVFALLPFLDCPQFARTTDPSTIEKNKMRTIGMGPTVRARMRLWREESGKGARERGVPKVLI